MTRLNTVLSDAADVSTIFTLPAALLGIWLARRHRDGTLRGYRARHVRSGGRHRITPPQA